MTEERGRKGTPRSDPLRLQAPREVLLREAFGKMRPRREPLTGKTPRDLEIAQARARTQAWEELRRSPRRWWQFWRIG